MSTDNALQLTGGQKVDYVVTGNVINAPDNHESEDTVLACANLLKKGGRVFHLTAYTEYGSEDGTLATSRAKNIGNADLYKFAGQKHLFSIPDAPYGNGLREMGKTDGEITQVLAFEQIREVEFSSEAQFIPLAAIECRKHPSWPEKNYTARNGKGFSDKEFNTYFFEHPEKFGILKGVSLADLDPRKDIAEPQDRAEVYLNRSGAFAEIESMKNKKGKPLSPKGAKDVIGAYNQWRDEMIAKIATEITPEVKRGKCPRPGPRADILPRSPKHHKPENPSTPARR